MPQRVASEPITIRTAKVSEIDALASAMDRSRNYIVNQAIEQYLEANAWQMERIAAAICCTAMVTKPSASRAGVMASPVAASTSAAIALNFARTVPASSGWSACGPNSAGK